MAGDAFTDYKPQSVAGLTGRQLKALQKHGMASAQTLQDINTKIAPQEQALQLQLLQQYGPLFSKVGQDISTQEAEAGISRDLALAKGPGLELAQQASEVDKAINPEFYKMREVTGKGYADLISGQDPNKLSGAELANTERGINRLNARTGNLNTGDATTTAANAMTFGDELGKKRDRFSAALNLFPGLSGASRSPVDGFAVATGKTSTTPNFGQQNFQIQNGQFTTQGMLDRLAGTQGKQMDVLSGRRNIQDYSEGAVGSVCCFIMISANDGIELPWWIKRCRDYYYNTQPRVKDGYRKMARRLVPKMERNLLLRKLIKYTMYYPLSFYGAYIQGLNKFGWMFKPTKNFWFTIWRNY